MKAEASVETVGKWILLLVILAIGLQLIFNFSDRTNDYTKDIGKEKYEAEIIASDTPFTQAQMSLYVRSCFMRSKDSPNDKNVCYILEGEMNQIDKSGLEAELSEYKLDASGFNRERSAAVIEYDPIKKRIVLKN
jgi:hypothetical protein